MKIIHTSDWHLGHILYNYDRHEEQQSMLDQMVEIVRLEQPDAFLIAGDTYDNAQPSASVQTMLSNALVDIHKACPEMPIISIAGNHDSSSKHMIFHTPWKALNVMTVGNINRESDLSKYIFKVKDKGFVVAVPYAADRNMPENVFQQLQTIVAEMNQEQLPVVLMAHLAVSGCNFKGHDNATEKTIGGLDCQDLESLGKGYDYVALGHIHRAQFIQESQERVRYCGTPIAISFDEVESGNEHSVSIIEIDKHGTQPQLRTIAIDNPHPLVNIPSVGFEDWETVKQLFAVYPNDIPAYIRLNVSIETYLPPIANSEAVQLAKDKKCRFCLINAKRQEQQQETTQPQFTTTEFQRLTPMEVAEYYLKSKGKVFDDDLKAMFEEALLSVNNAAENNKN